jgi:hypothetical protein
MDDNNLPLDDSGPGGSREHHRLRDHYIPLFLVELFAFLLRLSATAVSSLALSPDTLLRCLSF